MTDGELPETPSAKPPAPHPLAVPGKTMGIVAFVMSCFVTYFFVQAVGLVLGIVAYRESKTAGYLNQWALAAIVISSVLMALTLLVAIVAGMAYGSGRW